MKLLKWYKHAHLPLCHPTNEQPFLSRVYQVPPHQSQRIGRVSSQVGWISDEPMHLGANQKPHQLHGYDQKIQASPKQ